MATPCVIEISDVAVTVADGRGLRASSPGCAVVEGGELLLGESAQAKSRLNPRHSHDRFWAQLDQQPLHRAAGAARSHADLAWFHLQALWREVGSEDDEVVFAVPPDWTRQQLALLLGIAQACNIRAVGLVAAPVAAAASAGDDQPGLFLDAQLRSLRATRLEGGGELSLGASQEVSQRGLNALHDSWAALIAERFLHETRFDPLHTARTEQLLYSRLPGWLRTLSERASASLELEADQRRYRIELSRQAVVDTVARDYLALIASARQAGLSQVLMSHRLAALPGLVERFGEQALPLRPCAVDAVMRGALRHFERIRSDPRAPAFVTRLPAERAAGAMPAATPPRQPVRPAPSHVLHDWRAVALTAEPLRLDPGLAHRGSAGAGGDPGSSAWLQEGQARLRIAQGISASLNGQPVTGETAVRAGDRLRLGPDEGEWRFIRVDRSDGAE